MRLGSGNQRSGVLLRLASRDLRLSMNFQAEFDCSDESPVSRSCWVAALSAPASCCRIAAWPSGWVIEVIQSGALARRELRCSP